MREEQGFKVTQVLNPDSSQVEDAYRDIINAHGYQKDNRLLFDYSGDGYTHNNREKGYIVPTDAPEPLEDNLAFVRKAYSMIDLRALERKIEAHHAMFFI